MHGEFREKERILKLCAAAALAASIAASLCATMGISPIIVSSAAATAVAVVVGRQENITA